MSFCYGDAENVGHQEEDDQVFPIAFIRQLGQNVITAKEESPGAFCQEGNSSR